MRYLLYNADGDFSGELNCSTDDLAVNTPDGWTAVQSSQSGANTILVNGVITAKSQSDIDAANTAEGWINLRSIRNDLLSASDWTQSPDSPLTDAKKAEWRTYRQALRDITDTADPTNVTWPSQPT